MDKLVREYLAAIGRKGGLRSRRSLSPEQARAMVRVRQARRAFRRFHTACFWSYDSKYQIKAGDVGWVAEQLMKHGGREAWLIGSKLCR